MIGLLTKSNIQDFYLRRLLALIFENHHLIELLLGHFRLYNALFSDKAFLYWYFRFDHLIYDIFIFIFVEIAL